ncbi:hypothetical protein F2P81_004650 [Scophthalmus maximus]|uniref:Uncharacterized protein n=1 Tax=Scophthalmus maximus TaxID=52904 RepID=A0A6A4TBE7_SCOMX|nr:hypothetical protein F2P81_004650 [Scophthalmus maximus]
MMFIQDVVYDAKPWDFKHKLRFTLLELLLGGWREIVVVVLSECEEGETDALKTFSVDFTQFIGGEPTKKRFV